MANSDRKPFETATVLDQDFLDESQDNLVNNLELIVDIERPDSGFIRASDRNKYVGSVFYEALLKFPVIKRTVGEFLSPSVEFSSLKLELTNADGRFNDILPEGANFDGWIGNSVVVKLGLRDVSSTYSPIFEGKITEIVCFNRSVKSITFIARNKFDDLNETFPKTVFKKSSFAFLEDQFEEVTIPYIYGDWTTNVEPSLASIRAIPVNGADPDVDGTNDPTFDNVELVISDNDNVSFDTSEVYLQRGDDVYRFLVGDITAIVSNKTFEIKQKASALTIISPDSPAITAYEFDTNDKIWVKVKGKDIGAFDDNIVAQARDILETFSGLVAGDFNANWDTTRDKAAPTESAISTFKARVYAQEPQSILTFALSLLEQVRVEMFIDIDLKLKLLPIHFDEFLVGTFTIRNWDIERNTLKPTIDDRFNINRAKAQYNLLPNRNENFNETAIFRNDAAITQADGREISKRIVYPNLFEKTVVEDQLKETLKITSAYLENINVNLTWRSMLLDIGDFVKLNVDISGTQFENVPCLIREIGYDPNGIKIPVKMWSFQMTPFPPAFDPGFAGIVGGDSATITEET